MTLKKGDVFEERPCVDYPKGTGISVRVLSNGRSPEVEVISSAWEGLGLSVGLKAKLEYHQDKDRIWWIFEDRELPWFNFWLEDGKLVCCHYR